MCYFEVCAYLEWRPRLRRFRRLMSLPSDSAALFAIVLLRRFLYRYGSRMSEKLHITRQTTSHQEQNSQPGY